MPQFYTEEEAATAIRKLISKKMLQFARRSAHEALREHPDSRQIRFLIAFISSELKDYPTAAVLLEQLNNEDPEKIEILKSLIEVWNGLGEMNKAIRYNKQLEELTGRKDQALLANADIYERNNKIEKADEELAKLPSNLLEETPNINIRARVLISKKEYESAVDLLLKYEDNLEELMSGIYRDWTFYELPKSTLYKHQDYMRTALHSGLTGLSAHFYKKEKVENSTFLGKGRTRLILIPILGVCLLIGIAINKLQEINTFNL